MDTLLAGFFGLLGVGLGSLVSYLAQTRMSDRQERRKTYYCLMGLKATAVQYFRLRHQAVILSRYNQAEGREERAREWVDKANRMIFKAADSRKELLEVLGAVQLLFPGSQQINTLIDQVEEGTTPIKILEPQGNAENWKDKCERELDSHISGKINRPLDELLGCLRRVLNDERQQEYPRPVSANTDEASDGAGSST